MKNVIIIGGGVSGLTAGIYGEKLGLSCTVVDKNKTPGGALCGWHRNSHYIDGCVHWLTGTLEGTEMNGIWREVGMLDTSGIVKTDAFYTSTLGGEVLPFYQDDERLLEKMISLSPDDEKESLKFIRAVRAAKVIEGLSEEGGMSRSSALSHLAPYARLDLGALSKRFSNPLIRHAMTDYIGAAYSSLGLILAYAGYSAGNCFLPRGGSLSAARRMSERFTSLGGTLITGKAVRRILINGEKAYGVQLDNGEKIGGEHILICCDPSSFFGEMTEYAQIPARLRKYYGNEKYPVFSSLNTAFSVDSDSLPFKGTTIFSCRSLPENPMSKTRLAVREFSHEKSFAPEGKSIIQSLFFEDASGADEWIRLKENDSAHYAEKKAEAEEHIIERIVKQYPELYGKITPLDTWTPATFKNYLNSYKGAYMSFVVTPSSFPAKISGRIPHLENVRIASQWIKSPGGLPIAATAGKTAAETVASEIG